MLIRLKNYTNEQILSPDTSIAIDNLLRSFRERKHILLTDKSFFNIIINDDNMIYNNLAKQSAFDAMKGQTEYSVLQKIVNFYVIVDFNIQDDNKKWNDNLNTTTLTVGPKFFDDSSRLQSSNIIFENLNDNDFYQIIVNYFARKNNATKCKVSCNPINGGGGTTKEVFERHIHNNELILCLLDNDKKHPYGPLGSTSRIFGKEKFVNTGMVKILDVHEIESLIPVDTLEMSIKTTKEKLKTINFLKIAIQYDETTKFYFDHKKGLELKNALILDKLHGDYWIPLLKNSNIIEDIDCLNVDTCLCKVCRIKIEGLGENILNKSIDYIQNGNLQVYNPKLSPRLESYWADIGCLLFSWCCGPYRKLRLT